MDAHLTWNSQIDAVCKKLVFAIFRLSRLRNLIAPHIMFRIYQCIIKPILDYAFTVWGFSSQLNAPTYISDCITICNEVAIRDTRNLTIFNKIAIQGTPQMAVDKDAKICLSRVYSCYFKCNFPKCNFP